jgi:hypothetical protein
MLVIRFIIIIIIIIIISLFPSYELLTCVTT